MIVVTTVILVILAPLVLTFCLQARNLPACLPDSPWQHLETRQSRIYEGLRDLQFEYRVGKLSDRDYQQIKRALQQELAAVGREINLAGSSTVLPETGEPKQEAPLFVICPYCRKSWAQSMRFCGECGKSLP